MADGAFHISEQIVRPCDGGVQDGFVCRPEDADARRNLAETWLTRNNPEASCATGLTAFQKRLAKYAFTLSGLGCMIAPGLAALSIAAALTLVFAALIVHRCIILFAGVFACREVSPPGKQKNKTIWPVDTVLVAIYREPEAVPDLVAALKGLDYPKRQLDIQILIEESDTETLHALLDVKLKPHFRIVPVPKGRVQTKPRALNYGLTLARGHYVAVYDAEDQMHSGQLKAAVRAFRRDAGGLACVQAPLIPHNGRESWMASQFELEYLIQFGLIVPGLSRLNAPVMLGGTSNHFRRDVLEALGGWDAYNVTEDADLGLRLSAAGYKIGVIDPPTFEEAPVERKQWVGQRSRWVKGFIQTLGVFTRNPAGKVAEMGLVKWLSAMALLGGSVVSAILHGPLAIWLLACALLPGLTPPVEAFILLITGFGLHAAASIFSWPEFRWRYVFATLTAPLYWPLQTIAAIKAIRELRKNPYFWDKTRHGLTGETLCRSRLRAKL